MEHTLLKQMVNKELEDERKELFDLAERVGFLDPARHAEKMTNESRHLNSLPDLA